MTRSALRWGFLGTARINDRILSALARSERSEAFAVASRDIDRARSYATPRGIGRSFGSYEELIADDQVDVVYVSLPNELHVTWATNAARAGKHVLVEKPIALTAADVRTLIVESDEHAVLIQEASMMRFHEQTKLICRVVSEGVIGTPRWARGSFSFFLDNPGDIRTKPNGGGSLWDLGCYPVTLFQGVLQVRPLEVAAFLRRGAEDVDMTFAGMIRYEEAMLGQIATSMEALPSWSAEFLGSEGIVRVTYPWLSHLGVTSTVDVVTRRIDTGTEATFGDGTDDQVATSYTFEDIDAYMNEVEAFESMILDGEPSAYPLSESEVNIATIDALLRAADTGQVVPVGVSDDV